MSKWIKKGDKVLVVAGNDKGRFGEVLSRDETRVIVSGINVRKKHVKKKQQAQTSGIIELEKPISISNVALVNNEDKKIKLKVKFSKGGKQLVYMQDGKEFVFRDLKKAK